MLSRDQSQPPPPPPPPSEQFECWRSQRTKPSERIPEALWTQAVELTQVLTQGQVAKKLRLGASDLKRRVQATYGDLESTSLNSLAPTLIELPPPGPPPSWSNPDSVSVELERADGTHLRLRYAQALVAGLIQQLLSGA